MKRSLRRADTFRDDFDDQYRWYLNEAGEEVAERFLKAVEATLSVLLKHPGLGCQRRFRHPRLAGIRSFRVEPPFQKLLIFLPAFLEVGFR